MSTVRMCRRSVIRWAALTTIALAAVAGQPRSAQPASPRPSIAAQVDTAAEGAVLRRQLDRWRELYSYGDKPFSFDGFEDLYVNDDSLTALDSFAPKDTYLRGWANYRALWEPLINQNFTGQVINRFDVLRVEVSGDMALTAHLMWFDAKRDGKPFSTSQAFTHVWRKLDGEWRIVHEHGMGPVLVGGREIRATR